MAHTRTDTPDFSTRLSREELRVFTAVQGETALAAVVAKTRLERDVVEGAITKLVARKLLKTAGRGYPSGSGSGPFSNGDSLVRAAPGRRGVPRVAAGRR